MSRVRRPGEIEPLSYSERRRRTSGRCKRCDSVDVRVIDSIEGGWICWDLGACTFRHPLPTGLAWDRTMAHWDIEL